MKKTIITLLLIFVCACCFAVDITFIFTVAPLYCTQPGYENYVVTIDWEDSSSYDKKDVYFTLDGKTPNPYSNPNSEVLDTYQIARTLTDESSVDGILIPKTASDSDVLKVMYYADEGFKTSSIQSITVRQLRELGGFVLPDLEIVDHGTCDNDPARHVVSISCQTDGAVIYYTTNGNNPTEESFVYSPSSYNSGGVEYQGILVAVGSTIKTFAKKAAAESDVASLSIGSSVSGDTSFYFAQDLVSSVDLASNSYTGPENGKIGTVGINKKKNDGSNNSCVISIAPASGQWLFSVMEDGIEYDMPFGIDVVQKYYDNKTLKTGETVSFGIQASGSTDTPRTNSLGYTTHRKGNAVYWELYLVLDSTISGTTVTPKIGTQTYTLTESDNYSVSLIVTATYGSDTETYVVVLSGHYGVFPETTTCNISVTPIAAGSLPGLDIKAMFGTGAKTAVASYSFTTNTTTPQESRINNPGTVYIFLSSGNDGTIASDTFTLKHQNNPAKTVAYYAYLTSTDGYAHSSSGQSIQTVRFDGSTSFTAGNVTSDSLQIDAHESKTNVGNNTQYIYRWHDSGHIEIEIPANGQQTQDYINHLPSGTYYSDIYIHIVTDFNI